MILNSFKYLRIIKFVLDCEYWDRPPGLAPGVAHRFGSLPKLQANLAELQKRIYD
jgi:hypothetical protein